MSPVSELSYRPGADSDGDPDQAPLASTVLVVDDEPVVRDVLMRLLGREQDLSLLQAESGEEALELLAERRVDLLITDKNLAGMAGIELIRSARKRVPTIEAVMITGYANVESLIGAYAAGASDYLLKPFDDLQVVKAKLRAALERRLGRVLARTRTHALAEEAQALLAQGRDAPQELWKELESCFEGHDAAIRGEARGEVIVVGAPDALAALTQAGFRARAGIPSDAAHAAVMVLSTRDPNWREQAAELLERRTEVLLVAHRGAELSELLDAISLQLELIGFGTGSTELLPSRVRTALLRGGLLRAQERLTQSLSRFRNALR